MGSRSSLDAVEKRKIHLSCRKSNLVYPTCNSVTTPTVSRILADTDLTESRLKHHTQIDRNKFPTHEVHFRNVHLLVL